MWVNLTLQAGYDVLVNTDKVRLIRPCSNLEYSAILFDFTSDELIVKHSYSSLMKIVSATTNIGKPIVSETPVQVLSKEEVKQVHVDMPQNNVKPKGTTSAAIQQG